MKFQFHGAALTVTGSKHIITTSEGTRILLDCGMFQGKGSNTDALNRELGFDPRSIDYMILSHAHIDHSGLIPYLVRQGYRGKIFCTPPTYDLCETMLLDSAAIQESDARQINRYRRAKDLPPIEPIYDSSDVFRALQQFETVPYDKTLQFCKEAAFMFTDSGHIVGSAAVNLEIAEHDRIRRLCFTGDIGRPHDKILPPPAPFPQAEFIICESTYGNRLHKDNVNMEEDLYQVIQETCVEKRGKVIIPAFALDRTQELVYALDRLKTKGKLPPIPIYVDSPLAVRATDIMRRHSAYFNDEIKAYMDRTDGDPFIFKDMHYITSVEESKQLNFLEGPAVIISASGMAEAGRIKHHIKNHILDPNCTILMVGYCSPDSLGGRLRRGDQEVRIFGETFPVLASVRIMDAYSAHGDYLEMMEYLSCQDPAQVEAVFLVHGEPEAMASMKEELHHRGFNTVHMPEQGEEFAY